MDPSQSFSHTRPYPGQCVVGVQPAVFVTPNPPASLVPDHLAYSIFTMLCCCLPLGIAALVFSCSTRDAIYSGQQELAKKNSRTALMLNHIGLGIGIVFSVLVIIIHMAK
ncbi:synapse differentiation-inducing gene protein 1-like [Cyprinus carpio]|uniref:Synapse differentiation-inducing gene protein 1-like n=1 Tax=Cyprinus carpio TaxID=7962 RepID=A0A9R0BBG9_CYPCA|nr:synapse differentiation-inducing gene protein 1-like [Cyprinus carpio]